MNSKMLLRAYEHRYKEFFSQHHIVCSVPFSIPRSGGEYNEDCNISIGQKIPLRIYLWVKTTNELICQFDSISYQDIFTGSFVQTSLLEYLPYAQETERFLENWYVRLNIRRGFRISILTELPRSVGMWFDACFSLLIAVIMRRLENRLFADALHKSNDIPLFEALWNPLCEYHHIVRKLEELEHAVGSGSNIWSSVFTALSDWLYPVISFSGGYGSSLSESHDIPKSYYAYRLNDLISLSRIPYTPIDYGVLFSGIPITSFQYSRKTGRYSHVHKIEKFCEKIFSPYLQNEIPFRRPAFYAYLQNETASGEYKKEYEYVTDKASLEILYGMIKMYSKDFDDKTIVQYIHTVNKMRYIANLSSEEWFHLQHIIDELYVSFRQRLEHLALVHNNTGSWWSIAFVMPFEWLRTIFTDSVNEMWKKWQWVKMLYASRQDWTESKWISFDQDFDSEVFSSYMEPHTLCLHTWNWEKLYGDYATIMEKNVYDILVDTVHMKLYIWGEKPSSKELHTQSWAADVLSALFERTDRDVHNTQLPVSTYSKSKNDMNGKVILPLVKLVRQKTWKDILLTASGSLHSFSVRLNKNNLTMAVLMKCL